jgi:hypothetical protein
MTYLEAKRIIDALRPVYPRTVEQNDMLNHAFTVVVEFEDEHEADNGFDDEWIVGRGGTAYDTFRI